MHLVLVPAYVLQVKRDNGMYIYIYTHAYAYLYIYIYIYTRAYAQLYICIYECMRSSIRMWCSRLHMSRGAALASVFTHTYGMDW